jgi:signal transduction histidine kinase
VRRRKDRSLVYIDVTTRLTRSVDGKAHILSAEKDVTHIKVLRDAKLMGARFRELLDEVGATLRPQAVDKRLEFSVHLPFHPLVLRTDRRALRQIVLNLAGNALIKFTERGSVHLSLFETTDGGSAGTEIRVEDSGVGIGISAADQEKLFGAFSRAGNTRPDAPEGTGLGLHLSRTLAGLFGARIEFVALTAFSMPNDRQKVMTAGFDGYLSKRIELEKFVAQIEAFLPPALLSRPPTAGP